MVNVRSRSKAKAAAPEATLRKEPTIPTPYAVPDNSDLSEVTLRKLPRAELQKLAMANKVKANMKSELIIQQLSSLQLPKKARPAENGPEEGSSRKRFKREEVSEGVPASPMPNNRPGQQTGVQGNTRLPGYDPSIQRGTDRGDPRPPEVGPSGPRLVFPAYRPTVLPYDRDLFSGTESEMTEEEQPDFATPVSSRSGTPPAANVRDLERCVKIMREISDKDITLLDQITDVRETAAKLRKRARDVRDLVKAESGRRERMEAYFRYWQETEPTWDRKWLYGEKMVPEHKIRLEELDGPAGPPTIAGRQHVKVPQKADGRTRSTTPRPTQKPMLSEEQVKQKRAAIVSKQQAEQRELEALWRQVGEDS